MLVVHPASTCDVCLDGYTADSENVPHSITCGHVFCLNCLRNLRSRSCPLCRLPFEESDIRRLHLDRNDLSLNPSRVSPPPENNRALELRVNTLGLYEAPTAERLQQSITDVVFASILTDGVRESQVHDLLVDLRHFLSTQPPESHSTLRSSFLLLNRLTRLQKDRRDLETTVQRLKTESNRERQTIQDWERKYQDLQRSRALDQKLASEAQERLQERLRFEDAEWQKKYDYIVEESRLLREQLDDLRFSPRGYYGMPSPPSKMPEPTYFILGEERAGIARHEKLRMPIMGKDLDFSVKDITYANAMFRISPDPVLGVLSDEKSFITDELSLQKSRERSPELPFKSILDQDKAWCGDRSRPGSSSSSLSRASENVTTANTPAGRLLPIPSGATRNRSGSIHSRSQSGEVPRLTKDKQPEVSLSAPSSYESPLRSPSGSNEVRARATTTGESSARNADPTPEILRLYHLLDKPAPYPVTSSLSVPQTNKDGASSFVRPPLARSSSLHQSRPATLATSDVPLPKSSVPTPRALSEAFVQTSTSLPASGQQKMPEKRPALPHMHSLYSTSRTPASPQENRVGVHGTLPRRGSVSSASAAAALQAGSRDGSPSSQTSSNPSSSSLSVSVTQQTFVPPSALRFSQVMPRGGAGAWDYQDSD